MNFNIGNMWDVFEESDLFLITTNAYIKKSGEIVMGKGIASEAKQKFPIFPLRVAEDIQKSIYFQKHKKYGITRNLKDLPPQLRCFQVKYHYRDKASLDLIRFSTSMLSLIIQANKYENVHLNYPGIGNGNLSKEEVSPILEQYLYKHNVTIWEKNE